MQLNDEEQAMLRGEAGAVRKLCFEHQVAVGDFFGAKDFVPVTQAHIMADTESLGQAGVMWLEKLAQAPEAERKVRIPTITDPRGTDFTKAAMLMQRDWMLELERRAIDAFTKLGVSMTDTCINYQTIQAPTRGEHVAFGDTGVVIYSNSVCGARSNFEGGPSALSAGLTGRAPRYGYHLDSARQATVRIRTTCTPTSLNEWGALGGVIGRIAGNYWAVPFVEGLKARPARTNSSTSVPRWRASAPRRSSTWRASRRKLSIRPMSAATACRSRTPSARSRSGSCKPLTRRVKRSTWSCSPRRS